MITTTEAPTTTTAIDLPTECSSLPFLDNGHWLCHPDGPKSYVRKPQDEYALKHNQKCSPVCAHGFKLKGVTGTNSVHRCGCNKRDGCIWTKNPNLANCERDEKVSLFNTSGKGPSCPIPPEIDSKAGQWACDGMDGVALPWMRGAGGVRLKHGSKCMLQCNTDEGFAVANLGGRNFWKCACNRRGCNWSRNFGQICG